MGLALPDNVRLAPSLLGGLDAYYLAFMQLTTCRPVSEIVGPIPWTAINQFAIRHDITGDDFDDLVYLIGEMDDTYLKWCEQRSERLKKNAK